MILFNFQVAAAVQQEKLERSLSLNVERTRAEKMVDIKVPKSCLGQIKNIRGSSYPTDPKFGN